MNKKNCYRNYLYRDKLPEQSHGGVVKGGRERRETLRERVKGAERRKQGRERQE